MADTLKIVTEVDFEAASLQKLREAAQADIEVITDRQTFLQAYHDADIVCGFNIPNDVRKIATHLRWFQSTSAGLDRLQSTGLLDPDSKILVTRASGVHITQIRMYALKWIYPCVRISHSYIVFSLCGIHRPPELSLCLYLVPLVSFSSLVYPLSQSLTLRYVSYQ